MAARIRHIALCVRDIKESADFYEKALGLKRTEIKEGKTAFNCYMSDGEINIALLQYKSEEGSGVPKGWTGIHHFGFQCDHLPRQQKKIEEAGGEFFYDLGDPQDDGFERKFRDPNGIIFDVNWKGWQLTRGKIKNAKGGLTPQRVARKRASDRKNVTEKSMKRTKRMPRSPAGQKKTRSSAR
ncbi:MAG TPA: VOC family protein [Xanthobacteraceae bacterium]|jgi:predicted enzyme related to lactoylglutathione lyase